MLHLGFYSEFKFHLYLSA